MQNVALAAACLILSPLVHNSVVQEPVPATIVSEDGGSGSDEAPQAASEDVAPGILDELLIEMPEKRTRSAKVFQRSDGWSLAQISCGPQHYLDDASGAWLDLAPEYRPLFGGALPGWRSTGVDPEVTIGVMDGMETVSASNGDETISFLGAGFTWVDAQRRELAGPALSFVFDAVQTDLRQVDLHYAGGPISRSTYRVENYGLKHDLILEHRPEIPAGAGHLRISWVYCLSPGSRLEQIMNVDQGKKFGVPVGAIVLVDREGELSLQSPRPTMTMKGSEEIDLFDWGGTVRVVPLDAHQGVWELTVPVTLLDRPDGVYPLVIDPTLSVDAGQSFSIETVSSSSSCSFLNTNMYVKEDGTITVTRRAAVVSFDTYGLEPCLDDVTDVFLKTRVLQITDAGEVQLSMPPSDFIYGTNCEAYDDLETSKVGSPKNISPPAGAWIDWAIPSSYWSGIGNVIRGTGTSDDLYFGLVEDTPWDVDVQFYDYQDISNPYLLVGYTELPGTSSVDVSPTSLSETVTCGGSFPQKYFTIENVVETCSGKTINYAISGEPPWATLSSSSGTIAPGDDERIFVTFVPDWDQGWSESATLYIVHNGLGGSKTVSLHLTQEPWGTTLSVAPLSKSLNFDCGDPSQTFNLTVENADTSSCADDGEWDIDSNVDWLQASPSSGTLSPGESRTVTVTVDPSGEGLTPGPHPGELTVTMMNADLGGHASGSPRTVYVDIDVAPAPIAPYMSPVTLPDSAPCDGGVTSQTSNLHNQPGSPCGSTVDYTVTESAAWLVVVPSSGSVDAGSSVPLEFIMDPTPPGAPVLAPGLYTEKVYITVTPQGGGANPPPLEVDVEFRVNPIDTDLSISPSSINANAQCAIQPAADTIQLNTPDSPCSLATDWTIQESPPVPWLSVAPNSGTIGAGGGTSTALLNWDVSGLQPGEYDTSLIVSWNGGSESDTVPVHLSVAGNTPTLGVSPASLLFQVPCDGFDSKNLIVSNLGGACSEMMSWTVRSNETWLQFNPESGEAWGGESDTVVVTADSSQLAPGQTYYGSIIVETQTAGSRTVPVTFDVGAAMGALDIDSGPINLVGDCAGSPVSDTVNLSNPASGKCAGPVSWVVNPPPANWLTVIPSSGVLQPGQQAQVTATGNPAGLAPGHYSDIVTFTAPGVASELLTVNFQIVGTPAVLDTPTPSIIVEPYCGEKVQRTFELHNDAASSICAPDLEWTLVSKPSWVLAVPETGSISPGDLQAVSVEFVSGTMLPGTYVGELIFSAEGSDGSAVLGSPLVIPLQMAIWEATPNAMGPLEWKNGPPTLISICWTHPGVTPPEAELMGYRGERAFDVFGPWTPIGEALGGEECTEFADPPRSGEPVVAYYRMVPFTGCAEGQPSPPLEVIRPGSDHVGDLWGDGEVNAKDFLLLAQSYGLADPQATPGTDMNGDGVVDGEDVNLLLNTLGNGVLK